MTELYQDDVTDEIYQRDDRLYAFGIVAFGDLWSAFDAHGDTIDEDPEAVAELLHEHVDAWLEGQQQQDAGGGDERA